MSDDRYTAEAKQALERARDEARRLNHNYIGTEHLLLGLLGDPQGLPSQVLGSLGVDLPKARAAVESAIGRNPLPVVGDVSLTPMAKRALALAVEESRHLGHRGVGTEHLLLGLVAEAEGIADRVLENLGTTSEQVRARVIEYLSSAGRVASPAAGQGMTDAELRWFLAGPWNARVGCLTDSGAPYVVPAWYEWDGQDYWLVPRARSVWARYLQRDGRVCLCIDQDAAPHRRVQVLGEAEIVETPNVGGKWVAIAERMARRYLGAEDGPKYLLPTLDRPRWLIRVRPSKVTTWGGGGWHPRYLDPHPST
jgi:nitroimidazol reductase NimA-like FMN-containing flavoprotein (pyridoxamine 5'-phosphate oxidase superfamily)